MFELPIKGDIDRTLSNLMHDARHRLMIETSRIMAEAAQAGAPLQGNRVIITFAEFADQIHDAAMQATPILLDFIEQAASTRRDHRVGATAARKSWERSARRNSTERLSGRS